MGYVSKMDFSHFRLYPITKRVYFVSGKSMSCFEISVACLSVQNTALHVAAISTFPASVSCLLSNGAALTENDKGRTAIDLAIGDKNQPTALAFVNHKRWREVVGSASSEYGSVAMGLSVALPVVMLVALDRCILLSDHIAVDPEYHVSLLR